MVLMKKVITQKDTVGLISDSYDLHSIGGKFYSGINQKTGIAYGMPVES
jgi:hypothetical protein